MMILQALLLLLGALMLIPVMVFCVQVAFALPRMKPRAPLQLPAARPAVGVLVPAHNEAGGITATLNSILPQLHAGDRLLVVADNCTDDTAGIAWAAGAKVIQRKDAECRGKGYALDYGVRYFENHPPEVLIIIDADCHVEAGAIDTLASDCILYNRPVQALYLMHAGMKATLKTKVAEFAWTTKNWARPLGYHRMGLPCQLMGTGMAFPWQMIRQAELASGHIVEDLKLGLDLAALGHAPRFCQQALVSSVFPMNSEGEQSQRKRWEHGHLGMIFRQAPRQLLTSIRTGNGPLLALVLDMCVPPLALLTMLSGVLGALACIGWWLSGESMPWVLAVVPFGLLVFAVLSAWARFGRTILSFCQLAYAPVYALAKLPLYLKFLVQRQVEWVRSQRDHS